MIAVLGSINMDLVCKLPRFARPGETLRGLSFARYPGGKGGNQAVAAARLTAQGTRVSFYGKVGNDFFGRELLRSLKTNGVNVDAIDQVKEAPSGIASIWVTETGENAIVYVPGANAFVDPAYVDRVFSRLIAADLLLLQFEIPLETITYLLQRLPPQSPLVILDPAPVQDHFNLPFERVNIITPNRGELIELTGEHEIEKGARKLLKLGVGQVICKAGADGAYLITRDHFRHFPAFPVKPVDTTAAGDAFNGALAVALMEGKDIEDAINFACIAGALATTKSGAFPSLPYRHEVEDLIARNI